MLIRQQQQLDQTSSSLQSSRYVSLTSKHGKYSLKSSDLLDASTLTYRVRLAG
jgi:hypothetical protein